MKTLNLTINGQPVAAAVEPRTHLADFLREHEGLTGTHLGCHVRISLCSGDLLW